MTDTETKSGEDSPFLSLRLTRDIENNDWFVERISIESRLAQHSVSFRVLMPIAEVLTPKFHDTLMENLPITPTSSVISLMDVVFEMPHLILQGLRVVAQSAVNGMQSITVRFMAAIGSLQAILRPEHRTDTDSFARLEGAAARTLVSLIRPVLDLAEVGPSGLLNRATFPQVAERLDALAREREDIGFFATLLERFIVNNALLDLHIPMAEPVLAEIGSLTDDRTRKIR